MNLAISGIIRQLGGYLVLWDEYLIVLRIYIQCRTIYLLRCVGYDCSEIWILAGIKWSTGSKTPLLRLLGEY